MDNAMDNITQDFAQKNNEYIGWTWAYCSRCGNLHQFYDKEGKYNDKLPTLMCPDCKYMVKVDKFLRDKNIKDKKIIKEFKNIINNARNNNIYRKFTAVLKEAIRNVNK